MTITYKLTSSIPGVDVRLTPNPLNAKIILSESAKRELALMIAMEELEEPAYSAFYHAKDCAGIGSTVDGKFVPNEPNFARAISEMENWRDTWFGKDGNGDVAEGVCLSSADRWLANERVQMWLEEIDTEHCGDCTCVPCSCTRCHMERLLGIDTLPVGKHVAYRLRDLWLGDCGSDEQKEEIRQRHAANKAKNYGLTDEQLGHWKPKWDEQQGRAEEYYAEHKRLYAAQEAGA